MMNRLNKRITGLLAIWMFWVFCFMIACNNGAETPKADTKNKLDALTEQAIERGILKAKKTLQKDFLDVFEAKDDKNYNYSVKMNFKSFTEEEHIWLDNLRYDGSNTLIGFLANEPKKHSHIKAGDQLKIVFEDVVDWMYLRDDVLYGGYTIKALRENMTDAQKAAFDEKSGFKIIE